MRAYVRFGLPDGTVRDLGHGDLVGRLWSAACALDDPRISEAHALVSLRGSALKLLALRGRFASEGAPLTEITLAEGQRLELAEGLHLDVLEVELPDEVMALEGDGLPRQVLPGTASIRAGARVELTSGYHPDADAFVWSDGHGWRLRARGDTGPGRAFAVGDTLVVAGRTLRATVVALDLVGQPITLADGGVSEPIHLVVRYDTAHFHRGSGPPFVLDGISARIIGELVAMAVPAPWEVIARELWPEEVQAPLLRKRWDVALWRLRRKLRDGRVRADLLRADGSGNIELWLARGDTLESTL